MKTVKIVLLLVLAVASISYGQPSYIGPYYSDEIVLGNAIDTSWIDGYYNWSITTVLAEALDEISESLLAPSFSSLTLTDNPSVIDSANTIDVKPGGFFKVHEPGAGGEYAQFEIGGGLDISYFGSISNEHMSFQKTGDTYIAMFEEASLGETQELKIYGWNVIGSLRSLEIGIGVDAQDTASFDGLGNYLFDGFLTASNIDQDLRVSANPTLAGLTLSGLTQGSIWFSGPGGTASQDNSNFFWDDTNKRIGIGTATPNSGLHYQGDTLYLTPAAGAESNDDITIKNYATGNGAPDIILRTADIDGAYGIGVGTLSLIGGSKTTLYGGIGGGGGEISLQGGQGRDAANDPSGYAPVLLQSTGGKVGIGTAAPGEDLEIQSSSPVLRLRDTGATASATAAFIEFGGTDAGVWSRTCYAGDGSSGNTDMYIQAEISDLHLGDSSGNSVVNLQGGNVGIGTTTPAGKLSINGGLHVGGDSNAGDNNLLVDGTANVNALVIGGNPSVISSVNAIQIKPSGDTNTYTYWATVADIPYLYLYGSTILHIQTAGGAANSPTLRFEGSGSSYTDVGHSQAAGEFLIDSTHDIDIKAGNQIKLITDGDTTDYIEISTTANQTKIWFVGQDGLITATGGDISFDDENIITTGAVAANSLKADSWKNAGATKQAAWTTAETGALFCDGDYDKVETDYAGIGGNADRSISFWINRESPPAWGTVVVMYGNPNPFTVLTKGLTGVPRLATELTAIDGTTNVCDGSWHFVCVTFEGSGDTCRAYVDGGSDEFAAAVRALNTSATQDFNFGGGADGDSWTHDGSMSDVMFWNDDLSEAEAAAVEALGRNPTYVEVESLDFEDTDLVSWWRLVLDATDSWSTNHGTFIDEAHVVSTSISGLTINEPVLIADPLTVAGPVNVQGVLSGRGNLIVGGDARVVGEIRSSTLTVNGSLKAGVRLYVNEDTAAANGIIGINTVSGYDSKLKLYEDGTHRGGLYHDASSNDVVINSLESGSDVHINAEDDFYCTDVYGQTISTAYYEVRVNSSGLMGRSSSKKELKDHQGFLQSNANKFSRLKPAAFSWKPVEVDLEYEWSVPDVEPVRFGLYAEDVNSVYPELVVVGPDRTPERDPNGVLEILLVRVQDYDTRGVQALIITEVQRQQILDDAHDEEIANMQLVIDALVEQNKDFEARLKGLER